MTRSQASRRTALKRLGRTKPTGNFARIASKAARKYHSAAAGKRVAAAVYWNKVRARKGG